MTSADKGYGEKGFTLIEIAVAIAILGVALATLMGTTIRLMDSTHDEINRAQASLYASYILEVSVARENQAARGIQQAQAVSSTEIGQQQMGAQSGGLLQHLTQLGYFDGVSPDAITGTRIDNWTFEFIRQPLDIPLIPIPPQHLLIHIRWGPEAHESYTLETIRPPVPDQPQAEGQQSGEPDL
jgi:prepilin-type N-terminal cleavage/methylation domain-containing protein